MIPKLYTPAVLPDPLDQFGQLLAQAPFAVWVADRDGKVILFNEAMRQLVDIKDPDEVLGKYSLFEDPIAKSQGLVPYIRTALEGKIIETVTSLDLSREPFSGPDSSRVFYVRTIYFPLKDERGEYENVVAVIENITDRYLTDIKLSKMELDLENAETDRLDREKEAARLEERVRSLRRQLERMEKP
jgi:PAS domain S-box-containing protein